MAGSEPDGEGPEPWEETFAWVRRSRVRRRFFLGLVAIVLAWLGVWFGLPMLYGPEKAGLLGDSFGLLNSLIGGVTLLGVAYAAYLEQCQLKIARKQARDSEAERRENQRSQRLTSELNAYDSLVRYYSSLEPRGIPMNQYQLKIYLQMTRVVLTEIQNPDGEFDWKGTPEWYRTRFRRFQLCLMREARARYLELYRHPLLVGPATALLRELHAEFKVIQNQAGLKGPDRGWTHILVGALERAVEALERDGENPDESLRKLVDEVLTYRP